MKAISTPTAPAALGPYSQAIDAGAFVFVSGQVPVNPATGQIPLGAAAQAEQAFSNVRAILEAAGLGMDAVVKTTVFLSDLADFPTVRDFGDAFDLSAEDRAFVEMRLSVAREVDRLREEQGVSQRELARRMGTKQPTVSRMLKTPSSTTFDSLFRALLALGATPCKIASVLA